MSVIHKPFADFYKAFAQEAHACIDLVKLPELQAVVEALWQAYKNGKRVYVAGNGGSAATAIHIASCLGHGTMVAGKKPFRSETLCGNITCITAVGNDFGYEHVFTKQLENQMESGDVLIVISCSGNSPNVVAAAEYARANGGVVISLLGFGGGKLKELSHHSVYIENYNYGQVETLHLMLGHLISQYIKERIAEQ
jgi:D-sedoheptulose 7-phosphate isomerase